MHTQTCPAPSPLGNTPSPLLGNSQKMARLHCRGVAPFRVDGHLPDQIFAKKKRKDENDERKRRKKEKEKEEEAAAATAAAAEEEEGERVIIRVLSFVAADPPPSSSFTDFCPTNNFGRATSLQRSP